MVLILLQIVFLNQVENDVDLKEEESLNRRFCLGRGSGKKWSFNTCTDMGNSSVRDGLVYNGTVLPTGPPAQGHFAALLIWPDTNFHWIRMVEETKKKILDNSTMFFLGC